MEKIIQTTVVEDPVKVGDWVRMKRKGDYQNDLAQIIFTMDSGTRAIVKIVPRIDISMLELSKEERKNRKGRRPNKHLFDRNEIATAYPNAEIKITNHPDLHERCMTYQNQMYMNGFLIKEVNVKSALNREVGEVEQEEVSYFVQSSIHENKNDDQEEEMDTTERKGITPISNEAILDKIVEIKVWV